MGYDRDYGRRSGGDYGDRYRNDAARDRYGRRPEGYDHDDRGFFDRAGDEVRSWFGDEEAERRRRMDERYDARYENSGDYGRGSGRSYYDRGPDGRDPWRQPNQGYDRVSGSSYGDYGSGGSGRYISGGAGQPRSPDESYGYGANRSRQGYGQGGDEYGRWRQSQIDALDRDYDDYRRENSQRFENEFGTWRSRRMQQRQSLEKVEEHMEVIGSDGQHVGTVDKVRGERIILTKNDQDAGGHHHSIPCGWVDSVDSQVRLNKTSDEAKNAWRDEERKSALFGSERDTDEGPHILNRSFSGTYR